MTGGFRDWKKWKQQDGSQQVRGALLFTVMSRLALQTMKRNALHAQGRRTVRL
ncbi:hypothetical protein ANACOL_01923 [Anaerotruncus colihominis DSM 17241]|uniref:Uncharacterized protein n=1 Tax=Anaerotruncus colihominis DSM 17241 TaxID=445972 RepID=B0PAX2_9FIRM|nr:hypothetical protein ANACOL_01923 [Anaerotruncus colihominis DSM 17241]